jgi:hypothetical protein
MKALPKGQYIKHFQYGLGVITESNEQHIGGVPRLPRTDGSELPLSAKTHRGAIDR